MSGLVTAVSTSGRYSIAFLDDVLIFGFIIIYRRLEAEDDTILRHCTTLGK